MFRVMFRFTCLLVLGLSSAGCSSREAMQEAMQERQAKQKARIEAARIPEVQLSDAQMAKIRELAPRAQVVWLRAGRQSDGKIFVCHVISAKNVFGQSSVRLKTGTFEPDGSYQKTAAYLWSVGAVLDECHTHGFQPPVTIKGSVSVMRI
jgi:hypothetical protein